jgi:hypothetical protein
MKYSIMTNVKDEKDLLEWCIYHLFILKFDILYICDNGSNPSVKDILINNKLNKEIKTELNNKVKIFTIFGPCIKKKARQTYFNKYIHECDWTLFLDADEYLVLKTADNIQDFMNKSIFKNVDCIVFNWKMFGSNGIYNRNDKLVIENFTNCYSNLSREIKPFVKNKEIIHMGGHPHVIPIKNPNNSVNTNGEKHNIVTWNEAWGGTNYSCYNNNVKQKDCIFHFHWKSKEDFNNKVNICKNNGGFRDDGQLYNSLLKEDKNKPMHEKPWSSEILNYYDYYLLFNYSKKIKKLLEQNSENNII